MGTLTLAVTGATGYLGRAVVAEARAQGHSILVLVRDVHRAPDEWVQDPGIALLEGPLEQLTSATLEGVDAVLHLAAAMVGDDAVRWAPRARCWQQSLAANPHPVWYWPAQCPCMEA